MDFRKIIKKDGYKYEEMTAEDKRIIDWLNNLKEDTENYIANYEDELFEEDGMDTLDKIRNEIAIGTMNSYLEWLDGKIAEYQVALLEANDEE